MRPSGAAESGGGVYTDFGTYRRIKNDEISNALMFSALLRWANSGRDAGHAVAVPSTMWPRNTEVK